MRLTEVRTFIDDPCRPSAFDLRPWDLPAATSPKAYGPRPKASLVSVRNPPARQVVGGQLHEHAVPCQDADEVLPHLAGHVRQHLVLVLEFDAEHRVRQRLEHNARHLYRCLLYTSDAADE